MKTFKYNINGRELCIRVGGEDSTISDILVDGTYPQVAESEMPAYAAVISLALLENDIEVVHDDEPDVITLKPSRAGWVSPAELMNEKSNISKNLHAPEIPSGEGNLM